MMRAFLLRMFGSDEGLKKDEDKRFRENLRKLEEAEKQLDDLDQQLSGVQVAAKTKQTTLCTSTIALSQTINRSLTPPTMKAAKSKESDDQQDEERISGELATVGSHS